MKSDRRGCGRVQGRESASLRAENSSSRLCRSGLRNPSAIASRSQASARVTPASSCSRAALAVPSCRRCRLTSSVKAVMNSSTSSGAIILCCRPSRITRSTSSPADALAARAWWTCRRTASDSKLLTGGRESRNTSRSKTGWLGHAILPGWCNCSGSGARAPDASVIVARHGGHLGIMSEPLRGSEAVPYFPSCGGSRIVSSR